MLAAAAAAARCWQAAPRPAPTSGPTGPASLPPCPLLQAAPSHAPRDPRARAKALNARLMAAHTPQVGRTRRAPQAAACCWSTRRVTPSNPSPPRAPPLQEILGIVEAHLAEMDSINTTAALQRLARVRRWRPAELWRGRLPGSNRARSRCTALPLQARSPSAPALRAPTRRALAAAVLRRARRTGGGAAAAAVAGSAHGSACVPDADRWGGANSWVAVEQCRRWPAGALEGCWRHHAAPTLRSPTALCCAPTLRPSPNRPHRGADRLWRLQRPVYRQRL